MKKKILSIILIVIIVMIVSITTTYATNYLYNSNEVYYDNTNSNIASSDVQGAIDELYTEATNYSSINTRLTTVENNLQTTSVNEITSSSSNYTPVGTGFNYYMRNGVINIDGAITCNTSSSSWTTISTLPSNYRPKTNIYIPAIGWQNSSSDHTTLDVGILTNGKIQFRRGAPGTIYYFHISY